MVSDATGPLTTRDEGRRNMTGCGRRGDDDLPRVDDRENVTLASQAVLRPGCQYRATASERHVLYLPFASEVQGYAGANFHYQLD
jgi:hypothetical protein